MNYILRSEGKHEWLRDVTYIVPLRHAKSSRTDVNVIFNDGTTCYIDNVDWFRVLYNDNKVPVRIN